MILIQAIIDAEKNFRLLCQQRGLRCLIVPRTNTKFLIIVTA